MIFTVAVDGPAAAGKGTISRAIAERFGLVDWRMDGIVTETGECWTYYRPAGE